MITKVKMINCQSWKDSGFTLALDRLNTIIADNGTGKSVFMKMLKITACPRYFSREERKQLIRTGAESASIYFEFDDGGLACTQVFPTYTLYMYRPSGSDAIQKSYEPIPEVLKRAGLITDGEFDFVANIIDTDQDLLLVNSRLKNNYNLMQMHTQNPTLETVRERVHDIQLKILNTYSSLADKMSSVQSILDESVYYDIETRTLRLDKAEQAIDLMYQVIDIYNALAGIAQLPGFDVDFALLEKMITILELTETLNLEALFLENAPVDVQSELETIDLLDTLHLTDLLIDNSVPDISCELDLIGYMTELQVSLDQTITVPELEEDVSSGLQLLSLLNKINLDNLVFDDELQPMDTIISFLDPLDTMLHTITQYQQQLVQKEEICQELTLLKNQIMSTGETIICPVHGKVIYDGEECIPYSV